MKARKIKYIHQLHYQKFVKNQENITMRYTVAPQASRQLTLNIWFLHNPKLLHNLTVKSTYLSFEQRKPLSLPRSQIVTSLSFYTRSEFSLWHPYNCIWLPCYCHLPLAFPVSFGGPECIFLQFQWIFLEKDESQWVHETSIL